MRTPTMTRAILMLLAGLLLTSPAFAADPAPSAPGAVDPKERIDQVYKRVAEATATVATQDELVTALTKTLDDLMDYEAFAKRTLKTSWPTLTKPQRDIFMDRFKKLVVVVYAKRFKPRTAFDVTWREDGVKYKSEAKTEAKVMSTLKGGSIAADVDYYLRFGGTAAADRWFVYDFEIDQVSMALNWRKRFESIIKKDGFDALITKIESRIEKAED